MSDAFVASLLFTTAFGVGVVSTIYLWRVRGNGWTDHRNMILDAIFVVSLVVTLAAGYFGFLSLRRVWGFEPLPWTPIAGLVVSTTVLLIPPFLVWIVRRIQKGGRA